MILVCGEALIDLTPADCGGEQGFVPRPGGSPFNVAVGLGRLGAPTAFVGGVSTDRLGTMLCERLRDSGVDTSLLRRVEAPSPLALVQVDGQGRAEYSFYLKGSALAQPLDLPASLPPEVEAVHVGSIALTLEPGAEAIERLRRRAHDTLLTTLDPNVREPFAGDRASYARRLDSWLAATDIVKASDEDLAWLHPDEDPVDVAARWVADGPALAVVTRGADGATAVTPDATVRVAGDAVTVVDTVGAGDAFTSGLLGWLSERHALSRPAVRGLDAAALSGALRFAGRVAAVTCGRPGADPPRRDELGAPTGAPP